ARNPRGIFFTLQCVLIVLDDHSMTCASAGHHGGVRIGPGRPPHAVFTSSGRVLGLLPSQKYCSETLELGGGETYVFYTDGVSEAFDVNQELFGEDRLLAHLEA